jgi:hypothetical protein
VEWPPLPVKEIDWPPDIADIEVTESLDIAFEAVTESTDDTDPAVDSVTTWREKSINKYRPRGTARCGEYYRFTYKWYGKVKHRHIPGGNCSNPVAIARVEAVRQSIAAGKTTTEVLELIDTFRKPR